MISLTTLVGLDDVVVVTTRDAVLVSARKSAESVKDLVSHLRSKNHPEADEHVRVHRPWGWYQRLDVGSRFRVKRIIVKPGRRLSLQKHFHRAEHWVVVRGAAEVTVNENALSSTKPNPPISPSAPCTGLPIQGASRSN